jgi:rhamnopyranosyl-N-acetylglucosaminyl-diphospho-decaprenol beta-1,3/1,4-galactofuranosyltransferase
MNEVVYALMVTYNRLDTLKVAINHVLAQTVTPTVLIIADNNSTDGTKEYLDSLKLSNTIHCIFLPANTGSAGAISAGMSYGLSIAPCQYFWVLDDDTFYAPDTLELLLANMRNSSFAMVGMQGAHIKFGKKIPVNPMDKIQEVDYALIDGALILSAAVGHIGVVDPDFFMMCDDHEYCLRLRKHGFAVGVLKNGGDERLYLGGQSGFSNASLWRGYYSARNHLLILRKYFSMMNLIGYSVLQVKLIAAAFFLAPDRFRRVGLRLVGIWHGIKGVRGKTLDPQSMKFIK